MFGFSTKYVYIDESGNTSIATEKKSASKLYVPVAVVIDESCLQETQQHLLEIKNKFFYKNTIKSSSVSNEDKRIKILEEINKLNFKFFYIVIDKTLIAKDSSLQYRQVFYKFINKHLYTNFVDMYSKLIIYVDTYGGKDFEDSFKKYISKKFKKSLFNEEPIINYVVGKNNDFIGVADFLSGTIRLLLEKELTNHKKFLELINKNVIFSDRWPVPEKILENNVNININNFDNLIRDVSIHKARKFIDEHLYDDDIYIKMQTIVLRDLLSQITLDLDNRKGLYTEYFINTLNLNSQKQITERIFRQKVIGPLRDNGILITGSSKGYYLAVTVNDLTKFLEHGKNIILPMLHRINKAKETISISSIGKYDILSSNFGDFEILKDLLDVIKNKKIGYSESIELEESLYKIEQENSNDVSIESISE